MSSSVAILQEICCNQFKSIYLKSKKLYLDILLYFYDLHNIFNIF